MQISTVKGKHNNNIASKKNEVSLQYIKNSSEKVENSEINKSSPKNNY
jgi:hypothetical protein